MLRFFYLLFTLSVPAQAQTAGTGTAVSTAAWQPPPVILFGHPAAQKETWESQVPPKNTPEKNPKKAKAAKKKSRPPEEQKETPQKPAEPRKKLSSYRHFRKLEPWKSQSLWGVEQAVRFINLKDNDNRLTFKSGRQSSPCSPGYSPLPYYYWIGPRCPGKQTRIRPTDIPE